MSFSSFLARLKRKQLTPKDIESIREATPTLSQGSPRLFRNLRDKGNYKVKYILNALILTTDHVSGIISYTEYLFLLSILTSKKK